MEWSWLKAVVIGVLHVGSPRLRRRLSGWERFVNSLGAGMAVTYIFLHLLPELGPAFDEVGVRIYLVMLLGFVLYYGLERLVYFRGKEQGANGEVPHTFRLRLAIAWLHNWLILYAMPEGLRDNPAQIVVIAVAVGLHLLYDDYRLGADCARAFDRWGRYVLASGAAAGWLTHVLIPPSGEVWTGVFVALLAGSLTYSVCRTELPEHEKSDYRSFLGGVLAYLALVMLAERL